MERNLTESVYVLRARALQLNASGASLREICGLLDVGMPTLLRLLGLDSLRARFEKMEFSEAKTCDD